ncbi:hypothetical protein cypCar_00033911 [Cyprinus carpio]|nr:hypothetical protein cypCar_00033911 [Cyprinus carpio]
MNALSGGRQCQNQAGIITQGTRTALVETGEMKVDTRTGDIETTDHEATERSKDTLTHKGTPVIIGRECKE